MTSGHCHATWVKDEELHWRSLLRLAGSFFMMVTGLGVSNSLGVFFPVFVDAFGSSAALTSFTICLNYAMCFLSGPLCSAMLLRCGARLTAFTGGLLAAVGLVIASLAPTILVELLSLGIVAGFGCGLSFVSGIVAIQTHFCRWRRVAIAVTVSGVGVGIFVYPILINSLLAAYDWRGTMLITAGLSLQICVGAMFLEMGSVRMRNTPATDTCVQGEELIISSENVTLRSEKQIKLDAEVNTNDMINTSLDEEANASLLSSGSRHTCSSDSGSVSKQSTLAYSREDIVVDELSEPTSWQATDVMTRTYFAFLLANNFLVVFGMSVIYTHITAYAEYHHLTPDQSRYLLAAMGISSISGRLLLGVIGHHPDVDIQMLYIGTFVVTGLSGVIMTTWVTPMGLFTCTCVFGVFVSAIGSVLPESLMDIVGLHLFAQAYGLTLCVEGAGYLLGAPAAGWLYDVTLNYASSFFLGGATIVVGALLMLPPWLVRHLQRRKQQRAGRHTRPGPGRETQA